MDGLFHTPKFYLMTNDFGNVNMHFTHHPRESAGHASSTFLLSNVPGLIESLSLQPGD